MLMYIGSFITKNWFWPWKKLHLHYVFCCATIRQGHLFLLCFSVAHPPACLSFAESSWVRAGFDTQQLKKKQFLILVLLRHSHPTHSSAHDPFPRSPFSCVLPTVSSPQHSQQKLYAFLIPSAGLPPWMTCST